ncbi:hypothetical protein Ndes2437B_g07872 [Nannochloris sp. 'desiccata']
MTGSLAAQGRSLFRKLHRSINQLPRKELRDHYSRTLRTEFIAHSDLQDQELFVKLRKQSLNDLAWIINKYSPKISTTSANK